MKDFKKIIPLVILCLLAGKGLITGFEPNLSAAILGLAGLIAFQDKNLEDKSKAELKAELSRSDAEITKQLKALEEKAEEIKDIKSYILALKASSQLNRSMMMGTSTTPVASTRNDNAGF